MAPPNEASRDRDRDVRFGRRLRAGVVGVGLLGSFGLAGFLASSAAQNHPVASGAAPSQVGGRVLGDDGSVAPAPPSKGGVVLQPGTTGTSHATTGGSVHVSSSTSSQPGPAPSNGVVGLLPGGGPSAASTSGS